MGNCFSNSKGSRAAVGGTLVTASAQSNDAVDLFFQSRGYRGLLSQIEFSFSATSLVDKDLISKSDPMLVVFNKGRDGSITEAFRTEVIVNNLNPSWIRKFIVDFHFEVVQYLLFRVYDIDSEFRNVDGEMLKLEDQDFLGEASCVLSEVLTKPNTTLTLDLVRSVDEHARSESKHCGKLTVHAEEAVCSKTTTEIIFRCCDLEHKDLFSRIDPFLMISKIVSDGTQIPLCKTEVLKNTLNPKWNPVYLNLHPVGSKDIILVIDCYNFKSNGKHDLIGRAQKSLSELDNLYAIGGKEALFLPPFAYDPHINVCHILKSTLIVDKFVASTQHTFLDYLMRGSQLNFMVAIDFTASNGNPRLPDSLHYIDPSGRPNAYQQAIMQIGDVLQFYDSDKHFPAWGFGAVPIDGPVSHCFNLNGSTNQPDVYGIHGIMSAYSSALLNVSLAGPTLFGPVITNAADMAARSLKNQKMNYHVLLIITDGVVTDLQETKDAIVKASDLPLSILIVGVGGADFKEMEILDADTCERLESSTGRVASRDIVQFVPLASQDGQLSVVQELLAELPTQFLNYMRCRDLQPTF